VFVRLYVLWLLIGGLLGSVPARAQPVQRVLTDTLYLKQSNGTHLSESYRYSTESFEAARTPEHAESLWRAGRFKPGPWHKTLNLGFEQKRLWLRLVVINTLPHRTRFLWSLYSYTDSAALYWRRDGDNSFTKIVETSSQVPAKQRVFPARALCLPFTLAGQERAVLYLRIEHHAGALYVPSDVTTTEDFLMWEANYAFDQHWI